MRALIVLTVVLAIGLGTVGCRPKDAHEIYTDRTVRTTLNADFRSMLDDIHTHILMTARPSRLGMFVQE